MEVAELSFDIAGGPEDSIAYWIKADDDVRLRLAVCGVEAAANGTILFLPGRSDYIELYGRTCTAFANHGFATALIDWRGHGLSDRLTGDANKGHVGRFSDYQEDVAAMINAAEDLQLPKPWFLLGHSMGGCIGLRSLIHGLPVTACAFTAPMWQIHLPAAERLVALPASWAVQAVGKGETYALGCVGETYVLRVTFEENTLTHDQDMYSYWSTLAHELPDRLTGGPTFGWLYQALRETRSLSKMPSPDIPCLVYCGAQEEIVEPSAIEDRMRRWSRGRYELLPNAKHEILVEQPDVRNAVIASICEHFMSASA